MKDGNASDRLVVAASWIAFLLLGALAALPLVPPAAPTDPDVTAFSATQALDRIRQLAVEPRPIGTPANERARESIVAQLRLMGLEPELQTVRAPDYYGLPGTSVEIVNIVARIPGTAPTTAVALMGHYDTVPSTWGANDDASAVAILLEAARAILAAGPPRNDVILVFTDGEEPAPRFGSSAFVRSHPWFDDIGFVINLETIGSGGPSIVVEMNGPGAWIVEQYAKAAPFPAIFSFVTATSKLIGGSNTDFATFRDEGVLGVDLAYLHGSSIYHSMADMPERVSAGSLYQQGANALALARHFGNLNGGLAREDSEAVYFSLGRFVVVRYPTSWAIPLAALAGLMLIAAAWRQRGGLGVLRSIGTTVASTLLALAVAAGAWTLIGGWRSTMGIAESYLYLAGFVLLTVGIGIAVARLTRRRIGSGPDAVGVVTLWWAFGLLTAIAAPGMSYLFVWPALAAGLALLGRSPEGAKPWWRLTRWTLVAFTTLVVLVPAIDFFYQFAQPRPGNLDSQVLAVIGVPILLLSLAIELLRVFRVRSAKDPVPAR